jgi:hypothetical protein
LLVFSGVCRLICVIVRCVCDLVLFVVIGFWRVVLSVF